MSRYFFNLDHDPYPADEFGTVLPGPAEARIQALIAAGALLKDNDRKLWDQPEWRMHVTDEEGATVCLLTVSGTTGEH